MAKLFLLTASKFVDFIKVMYNGKEDMFSLMSLHYLEKMIDIRGMMHYLLLSSLAIIINENLLYFY
jgi:hypothetical protein